MKQLYAYSITAHKDRWAGLGRIVVVHHTAGALLADSEAEALGSAMMQARNTYRAVEGFSNQDAVVLPVPQGFIDATKQAEPQRSGTSVPRPELKGS